MTLFGWDCSDFDWSRGPMDLVAARSDGIDFVTHKGTEGTRFIHGYCGTALERARSAGIPFLGAYMVPRTPGNGGNGTVAEQVAYFLANVSRMVPWWPLHPGWFWQMDTEHWYTSAGVLYDAVSPAVGAQACQLLAQQTGRKVLHYAPDWSYGDKVPGAEPLWASVYPAADAQHYREKYAQIHADNGIGWGAYSGRVPRIWQYSATAIIGRQPRCDANAFRGTLDGFALMIRAQGDLSVDILEEDDMWATAPVEIKTGFAEDDNPADPTSWGSDPRRVTTFPIPSMAYAAPGKVAYARFVGDHPGGYPLARFRIAVRTDKGASAGGNWALRSLDFDARKSPDEGNSILLPDNACGISVYRQRIDADDLGLTPVSVLVEYY